MQQKSITFDTEDGATLSGTIFAPDEPQKVVVISGARGVPEGYYARFARWLVEERGFAVLTYTYRDMEDPSPRKLRVSTVRMQDWAITDGQAARDAAMAQFPGLPVWVIGHSLGGMMVSKQPRLEGIERVITVASGLVYHRGHPMPYKLLVYLFWFVLGPLTTRLLGYLPGETLGMGATLPKGVFFQWRRWCTAPNCFLDDDSLPASDWRRSCAPVRVIGIADDAVCTPDMAFRLAEAYAGGPVETMLIDPRSKDVKAIGHLGLFTRAGRVFWDDLIDGAG